MQKLIGVVSSVPVVWYCIECGVDVKSEENPNYDQNGNIVTTKYTPVSRYWHSPNLPNFTDGVFCSSQCSLNYNLRNKK